MPEDTEKHRQPQRAPKLPEKKEDNVVREEQQKGVVRPDGPGDDTAPIEPDHTQR